MAAAFPPILLDALSVLILKVFALCQGGRRVVVEIADAALEGVLFRQRVVDDFGGEVVGVAEVERRLVVEVFQRIARVDGDGEDYLGRVGFYGVGVGLKNVVNASRCGSGEKEREQHREPSNEYMSFHLVLQYFECFFDKSFDGGIGGLFQQFVQGLVDGGFAEAQYRQC